MNYILFAASPNQLISLKEYIYQNKIKNYEIYILLSDKKKVNIELNNTIKFLNLKNIKKIKKEKIYFVKILKMVFFLLFIKIKYKKKKLTFIFADFLNNFFHLLRLNFKNSKFILADDGFATFWIYNKYLKKKIYYPIFQKHKNSNKIVNYFFNFNNLIKSEFELFTLYSNVLGLNRKYLNKFSYCKSLIKKFSFDKSKVYLIGTKYSEESVLTLNEEIKALDKIITFWKKKRKDVIYVAKRTTSDEKINFINNKLDVETVYFEMPLELALIKKKMVYLFIFVHLDQV